MKIDKATLSTSPIALPHFRTSALEHSLAVVYRSFTQTEASRSAIGSHFNSVVAITGSNQLNKCNRGNRLNQHRKNPFPLSVGNLVRISIGNLRAIALLNNSQQVRSHFAISLLFIYQGEIGSFMQNSQVFLAEFCKH